MSEWQGRITSWAQWAQCPGPTKLSFRPCREISSSFILCLDAVVCKEKLPLSLQILRPLGDRRQISITGTTTWHNSVIVLVTNNRLLVRPRSRGGLGERPAPYPHRSADLCDLTAMTWHVARPQGVHLGAAAVRTFCLRERADYYPLSLIISVQFQKLESWYESKKVCCEKTLPNPMAVHTLHVVERHSTFAFMSPHNF
jgi:hypothetical protein